MPDNTCAECNQMIIPEEETVFEAGGGTTKYFHNDCFTADVEASEVEKLRLYNL